MRKKEAKSAKWMEIRARIASEKGNRLDDMEVDEAEMNIKDLELMEDAMKCFNYTLVFQMMMRKQM